MVGRFSTALATNDRAKANRSFRGAPTQPLDDQTVSARAAAVLRRAPDVPVLVKGDAAVSYGRVVEAMVILQGAGAKKIGFLTDPPPRKRAARR